MEFLFLVSLLLEFNKLASLLRCDSNEHTLNKQKGNSWGEKKWVSEQDGHRWILQKQTHADIEILKD